MLTRVSDSPIDVQIQAMRSGGSSYDGLCVEALRRDRKGKGIPLVEVYERILKFVISEWCKYPIGQTNEVYGFEKVTKASLLSDESHLKTAHIHFF